MLAAIRARAFEHRDLLLDLIEALLKVPAVHNNFYATQSIDDLLKAGNSAYRINSDRDGLEMRLAPGVKETVEEAINAVSPASSAGTHLTQAWNLAYGRSPNPGNSFSEAIKAVEAAAIPVVQPTNAKATLGTVIGELRANPGKWKFEIDGKQPGVETVLSMASLLWDGQTSRHGGVNPTRSETPEEARAAVHLAAALVQWFVSGALEMK